MKLKNKSQITAWLEAGELSLVLDELKQQLKVSRSGKEFLRTATNISAQLEKVKTDKLKGVITYEQENIAMNKLLDKVQIFIERIEAGKEKSAEAQPKTENKIANSPVEENTNSTAWWRWLVIPLVAFAAWWFFIREAPIQSKIRICTADALGTLNWCENDMSRMVLSETLKKIMVTAIFEGEDDPDPAVTGILLDKNGNVFPTQPIQLTFKEGGVGYSGEISPYSGVWWDAGEYTLQLQFNKKPAGEKVFELFGL
ncbi:MAG: hypothetical protein GC192_16530 [Bacteroidetes bacterium]|nr:hypothetical protein [Bacteroidota bacterium]